MVTCLGKDSLILNIVILIEKVKVVQHPRLGLSLILCQSHINAPNLRQSNLELTHCCQSIGYQRGYKTLKRCQIYIYQLQLILFTSEQGSNECSDHERSCDECLESPRALLRQGERVEGGLLWQLVTVVRVVIIRVLAICVICLK